MRKLKELVQEAEDLIIYNPSSKSDYVIKLNSDKMGNKIKQINEWIEKNPKISKKHGIEVIRLLQNLVKKLKEVKI